jgi:hypothetical protein
MKLTDNKKRLVGVAIQLSALCSYVAVGFSVDRVPHLVLGTWFFLMALGAVLSHLGREEQIKEQSRTLHSTLTESR